MRLAMWDARRAGRLLLAVAGLLLASCTDQQPAGPAARRDGEAVERWEPHGTFQIPVVGDAPGFPFTSTGITLDEGQRARIIVGGGLGIAPNPSYAQMCGPGLSPPLSSWEWGPFCPTGEPYVGKVISPRGYSSLDDVGKVTVYIERPDGRLQQVFYGVDGDPPVPETIGPGTLYVTRSGWSDYFIWKGVPIWNVEGGEALAVLTLAPDSTPCGASLYRSARGARLDVTGTCPPSTSPDTSKLQLRCPTSVDRGQSATCTVSAGTSVPRSIVWTFVDSLGHTTHDSTGVAQWGGEMAVGGEMQVAAVVDGNPQAATATIKISPRHWPRTRVVPVDTGNNDLPAPASVAVYEDLAHSVLEVPGIGSYPLKLISDGPNTGYWYVASPFQQLKILVSLNYAAFAQGSAWYQLQTGGVHRDPVTNRPTVAQYCNSGDLKTVWRLAREHEGIDFFADSHVKVYQDWFRKNNPEKAWEAVVIHSSEIEPGYTAQNAAMQKYGDVIWTPSRVDPDQFHTTDPVPGRVPPAAFPCYLRPMN